MSKVVICMGRGSGKTNLMKEIIENAAKQQMEMDDKLKNKENKNE